MFGMLCATAVGIINKHNARQEWLNSLPKDVADRIRADDARIAKENELHRRKLDIAEAGRARNFWGN